MSQASRAFQNSQGGPTLRSVPVSTQNTETPPYASALPAEMPPMMFQLRLNDGRWLSYSYSDVREIESRDAGQIKLTVFAASRTLITIEGRNLRELATLFGMASVRWLEEADPRGRRRPESSAEIMKINVETAQAA
ncbi:hypothetical protein RISK_005286 [Rhodopirellula islandica]|uniref:Uncharacterized protein n=1 Tax=Rhodopirellula islandica TaxID=595434 RepID=A0A0J1B5Y0_RHOIS|nr:hypothetical protein [Rhodopirellula islandica]KLU02220.1 hypothetical protein RISK_005286 [Rhodopirellula islandica]